MSPTSTNVLSLRKIFKENYPLIKNPHKQLCGFLLYSVIKNILEYAVVASFVFPFSDNREYKILVGDSTDGTMTTPFLRTPGKRTKL